MIIPVALPEHCKQDKAACKRMFGPMWPFQVDGRLPKYFDVRGRGLVLALVLSPIEFVVTGLLNTVVSFCHCAVDSAHSISSS